eukprot:COSAG02_NODE_66458_length_255_cov_0.782051_2_plen_25_part_01
MRGFASEYVFVCFKRYALDKIGVRY